MHIAIISTHRGTVIFNLTPLIGLRVPKAKQEGRDDKRQSGPQAPIPHPFNKNKEPSDILLCIVLLRQQAAQTPFFLGLGKFLPFFPLPCHISFI